MQLSNAQATVVEWGPGPQTVQADRYAIYKMELEPSYRAISGLTGTLWDQYAGSYLLKQSTTAWPGKGSTYFYRGIKIINNTGYTLFLPDRSDLEKKLVYYHIKEVSGVTTTQERYQDNLQVYDYGIGYNAMHADGEHFPTAVWVDGQGRLRNDRGTAFKTSNGQSLCFSDNSYIGYAGFTAVGCGTGWVDGGVSTSLQVLYDDGDNYRDYVGHGWSDYISGPYIYGTLSNTSQDGGAWSVRDEHASNLRPYGDLFNAGTSRYTSWWTYIMSKDYSNYNGTAILDDASTYQGNPNGACPNGYPWAWVTVRMCYKSASQGS